MRLSDFEAMVRRQVEAIPPEFLEGIVEIAVSPRTVPHPERSGIWTMGECIPLPVSYSDPGHLQSRVVLYHGSFLALARDTGDFDWKAEAWETLTHEVRHHVEWKARVPDLEAFDRAAEANFSRQEGQPFDPVFYRDGVERPDGLFQVDDDVFLERIVSERPGAVVIHWAGKDYRVELPGELTLPAFLSVGGVADPPPGELVLVVRRKTGLRHLLRQSAPFLAEVEAVPLPDYLSPPEPQ